MTEWPNIGAAYDVVAEEYAAAFDDELRRKPFDRELLDGFAGEFGNGNVWDLGCGPGHVGDYLARQGVAVTGFDLSGQMLAIARRLHPNVTFVQGNILALPVRKGSLSGIVAFYSLIHVPRPSIPRALEEIRRALRRGGSMLIAVHVGEGDTRATEWFGHEVSLAATLFEREELAALVEDAGMGNVDARTRTPYAFESRTHRLYLQASKR